jgi:glycosyltransferase involved in cell wall biosynthesis
MKIFVTGTRGIPDIPGGVEKHCQELYPRISARGNEVAIATRSSYIHSDDLQWQNIRLIKSFAPRLKSLEAILHTFFALLKARSLHPDVVHIHAIGPALLTPVARLLGYRVVITNHGPEYDRQKWGKLAKSVLRFGEKLGGTFANEVIVISSIIQGIIRERCHREGNLIYNGVPLPQKSRETNFLNEHGIESGKYLLAVARFVPEKGLHDLVDTFKKVDSNNKLVIAGDADHETDYSKRLRESASKDNRIILTGYITGEELNQVYSHARLFVLPSYHEGLPISLLEAMSYGLPVLVSDIPANKEVKLPKERYFKCGDIDDLKEKIEGLLLSHMTENEQKNIRKQIEQKYNWDKIADQTIKVYEKVLMSERRKK